MNPSKRQLTRENDGLRSEVRHLKAAVHRLTSERDAARRPAGEIDGMLEGCRTALRSAEHAIVARETTIDDRLDLRCRDNAMCVSMCSRAAAFDILTAARAEGDVA